MEETPKCNIEVCFGIEANFVTSFSELFSCDKKKLNNDFLCLSMRKMNLIEFFFQILIYNAYYERAFSVQQKACKWLKPSH